MTSFIAYRGPSLLDGSPVALVVVGATSNRKTGDMVQTYIIPDVGLSPQQAAREGRDAGVCGGDVNGGGCGHRPVNGGTCYVKLFHGPRSVWAAMQRGRYAHSLDAAATLCQGRMVRLGTYGDPAAVPLHVWNTLTQGASGWTGYTHQWRTCDAALMLFCMASVDSEEEATQARNAGWRYFRVRAAAAPVLQREMVCPASHEAGKRLDCAACGSCKGTQPERRSAASVVIVAHGSMAKYFGK